MALSFIFGQRPGDK